MVVRAPGHSRAVQWGRDRLCSTRLAACSPAGNELAQLNVCGSQPLKQLAQDHRRLLRCLSCLQEQGLLARNRQQCLRRLRTAGDTPRAGGKSNLRSLAQQLLQLAQTLSQLRRILRDGRTAWPEAARAGTGPGASTSCGAGTATAASPAAAAPAARRVWGSAPRRSAGDIQ